jgi:hypothetical protein
MYNIHQGSYVFGFCRPHQELSDASCPVGPMDNVGIRRIRQLLRRTDGDLQAPTGGEFALMSPKAPAFGRRDRQCCSKTNIKTEKKTRGCQLIIELSTGCVADNSDSLTDSLSIDCSGQIWNVYLYSPSLSVKFVRQADSGHLGHAYLSSKDTL